MKALIFGPFRSYFTYVNLLIKTSACRRKTKENKRKIHTLNSTDPYVPSSFFFSWLTVHGTYHRIQHGWRARRPQATGVFDLTYSRLISLPLLSYLPNFKSNVGLLIVLWETKVLTILQSWQPHHQPQARLPSKIPQHGPLPSFAPSSSSSPLSLNMLSTSSPRYFHPWIHIPIYISTRIIQNMQSCPCEIPYFTF